MAPLDALMRPLQRPGLFWGTATLDTRAPLHPIEAHAIANASPTRQDEFRAGRSAARQALAAAGMLDQPVPMAADRSPVWPDGIRGSLSHAGGYAICAVMRGGHALGLDLEQDQALPANLAQNIVFDGDQGDAAQVFSAKEAVYKALYPLCGVIFGFEGMRVRDGVARLVETAETRAIPPDLMMRDWPVRQSRAFGLILSLCVTQA